jgi:eukaryotic-like serine/threonine-protein kinase
MGLMAKEPGEGTEMKTRIGRILCCLLVGAGLAVSACQAWPATVAPVGGSARAEPASSSLPGAGHDMKVLWTFATRGPIWGTATIDAGTVYVGSDDGYLYALAAKDGRPRWKFATQGIVRSRPAVSGKLVYVASDDGCLYAVDARRGTEVWRTDIGNAEPRAQREKIGTSSSPTGYDYLQSSPVVTAGRVFVGSLDGKVYALDATNGSIRWTFLAGAKLRATPTVDKATVYVGSWDLSMYALDAATGEKRWQTMIGGEVQSTALVDAGTVYCASRKASIVALDARTGEKKWEYDYGTNMWVESSPRIAKGILYIGSSGSQIVVALDSRTGREISKLSTGSFHWSTPAIVGNVLYIGATSARHGSRGGLFALRLVDGEISLGEADQRLLPVEETLEAEGNWSGVASSPLVVDGVIYFGGLDGKVYAVKG